MRQFIRYVTKNVTLQNRPEETRKFGYLSLEHFSDSEMITELPVLAAICFPSGSVENREVPCITMGLRMLRAYKSGLPLWAVSFNGRWN